MARRDGSLTLAENVFTRLRADILSGALSPGASLMPGELRTRFNVSVAVIREALTRLAEQGLARQNPNYGFSVMTLSQADLENIIEAREINEGAALRLAISKGDVIWESNIVAIYHRLEQTPEYLDENKSCINENWSEIHHRFHSILIEACHNPVLLDICARLWDISELYRYWSVPRDSNRPLNAEHTALMKAVLARDAERAVALFNAHIRLTVDILLEHDGFVNK